MKKILYILLVLAAFNCDLYARNRAEERRQAEFKKLSQANPKTIKAFDPVNLPKYFKRTKLDVESEIGQGGYHWSSNDGYNYSFKFIYKNDKLIGVFIYRVIYSGVGDPVKYDIIDEQHEHIAFTKYIERTFNRGQVVFFMNIFGQFKQLCKRELTFNNITYYTGIYVGDKYIIEHAFNSIFIVNTELKEGEDIKIKFYKFVDRQVGNIDGFTKLN